MITDIYLYKVKRMDPREVMSKVVERNHDYSDLFLVGRIEKGLRYSDGTNNPVYVDVTLNSDAPIKLEGDQGDFPPVISCLEGIFGRRLKQVRRSFSTK